jgi:NAD(P)-dependent dehydrogenase (short-subunit alcohol dehydrogenase family)
MSGSSRATRWSRRRRRSNWPTSSGPSGINVTVVHPGMTRTERTPQTLAANAAARGMTVSDAEAALTAGIAIGRLVTAEEVAAAVAFLASPLSVAITGDAIAAGGGARGSIHY